MKIPTPDELFQAQRAWHSVRDLARRGKCSWCFVDDALRRYTKLCNQRAAAQLVGLLHA